MSKEDKLDKLDREILKLLQENGRMKYTEIANKLNKRPSTIYEKIKKLESTGVIKGYSAIINPEKVEKGLVAFVLGQAKLGPGINLDKAGEEIAKIPEVQEVHFVTGEWDYLIKIRVKDHNEYYKVVQKVAKHFGGRGTGMIVPKTFKDTHKLPL